MPDEYDGAEPRLDEPGEDRAPAAAETHPPLQEGLDLHLGPRGVRAALEAVLMVADEPVPEVALAAGLEVPVDDVGDVLQQLAAEYTDQGRGFELRQVAGGWRFYSRKELAGVVQRFLLEGQSARLTRAALETLAVVAYRQPVSRGRIAAIRGVNVDGVVRTLLARGLVSETGQDAESGATLYGTTGFFLEKMGLGSLDELPALAPYLPKEDALDEFAEGHG